jgi:heme-degrading monooxygenase HmoA
MPIVSKTTKGKKAVPRQKAAKAANKFIQLHVDMVVLPGRESEMVSNFKKVFTPVISKQPGFVAVWLLKLRSALAGEVPGDAQYRLLISFKTEKQRLAWVATDEHQEVWPSIANTLDGFKAYVYSSRG